MGGKVALKGSDGADVLAEARRRGAEPVSPGRAIDALRQLALAAPDVEVLAAPGVMGEAEARAAGLDPAVAGTVGETTSAADTRALAAELVDRGVDLILFAGGDGTAVDVLEAVGDRVPVLGIPAGVKMHSAVFGVNPRSAGELAAQVALGRVRGTGEAEVMDVDEQALRAGVMSARLHGYARVPVQPTLVQGGKARSAASERASQEAIGRYLAERVLGGRLALIGPGTTTRAITDALGLEKTLLGVDVVRSGVLVERDADERRLLELVGEAGAEALIVVTPIGGQGFVFGRGNQQLSARVIEEVGPEGVLVVATEGKLAALGGRPLLVDTGDDRVDDSLAGYVRIVTGYEREAVYQLAA